MSNNYRDHKYLFFGMDHYNILGAIRSIGEVGIAPDVIVSPGRWEIVEKCKYVNKLYKMKDFDDGFEYLTKHYKGLNPKPFIVTCDDHAMEYLDLRYDELKNDFILFNANGEPGRVKKYMDKFEILEIARKNGLNTLNTTVTPNGVIPQGIEYPIITKSISPNVGGWKSDVFVCENEFELTEAFKRIKSPFVLVQKYIHKINEYCIDGFSIKHGEESTITIAATYNYLIPDYYSTYMTVANFDKEELREGIYSLLKDIGYEGIWCIEFLIDQDGTYYFTEVNFRNSGWSYASTKAGMNLPYLWSKSTAQGYIDPDEAQVKIKNGFTAMIEPIDYRRRVVEGDTDLGTWLLEFKKCDCGFYYSEDDPEPFIDMVNNWDKLN